MGDYKFLFFMWRCVVCTYLVHVSCVLSIAWYNNVQFPFNCFSLALIGNGCSWRPRCWTSNRGCPFIAGNWTENVACPIPTSIVHIIHACQIWIWDLIKMEKLEVETHLFLGYMELFLNLRKNIIVVIAWNEFLRFYIWINFAFCLYTFYLLILYMLWGRVQKDP